MKDTSRATHQELEQSKETASSSKQEVKNAWNDLSFNFNILETIFRTNLDKLSISDRVQFENLSNSRASFEANTEATSSTSDNTSKDITDLNTMNSKAEARQIYLSNLGTLFANANFSPTESFFVNMIVAAQAHSRQNFLNSSATHMNNLLKVKSLQEKSTNQTPGDFIDNLPSDYSPLDDASGGD